MAKLDTAVELQRIHTAIRQLLRHIDRNMSASEEAMRIADKLEKILKDR